MSTEREKLLDELALIFGLAALDALYASENESAPAVGSRQGREAQSHHEHDKFTLPEPNPATSPG